MRLPRPPSIRELVRQARAVSLSQRMTTLMALAAAVSVLILMIGTYATLRFSLYTQLDKELTDVAAYVSNAMGSDSDSLAGLNAEALRAGNATVLLVRSDGQVIRVPGDTQPIMTGAAELEIARTQMGSSARTGHSADGTEYRLVSVPKVVGPSKYALVLGRPIDPTRTTLELTVRAMTELAIMVLVCAVLLGRWAGKRTIEPIRDLSREVANITETDRLHPIEATSNDEVGDLTRAFNTLLVNLHSSRERQKRLIADAGHELRTPLTSMRTNIELLVADENSGMLPEGARAEILRDVSAQLSEFSALVSDLVQLSRNEEQQLDPQPLDLQDVVGNAITRARRRSPGLMFDVQLSPLLLEGDPGSLERAITNLLDNAVKFSPPGGVIHVMMNGNLLTVADQGPGIADEDLPHVFERFYRSDRSRNTPGTGLGLSIVAHTINGHGGWVRAGRSDEGGAEFTVWLPGDPGVDAPAEPEEGVRLPRRDRPGFGQE